MCVYVRLLLFTTGNQPLQQQHYEANNDQLESGKRIATDPMNILTTSQTWQTVALANGGNVNDGMTKTNSPRFQKESIENGSKVKKVDAKKRKRSTSSGKGSPLGVVSKKQQKSPKTKGTDSGKTTKKSVVVKRTLDVFEQVVLAKKPEQYDDEDEEYLRMRRAELRSERQDMVHGVSKAKDGDRPHRRAAGKIFIDIYICISVVAFFPLLPCVGHPSFFLYSPRHFGRWWRLIIE